MTKAQMEKLQHEYDRLDEYKAHLDEYHKKLDKKREELLDASRRLEDTLAFALLMQEMEQKFSEED